MQGNRHRVNILRPNCSRHHKNRLGEAFRPHATINGVRFAAVRLPEQVHPQGRCWADVLEISMQLLGNVSNCRRMHLRETRHFVGKHIADVHSLWIREPGCRRIRCPAIDRTIAPRHNVHNQLRRHQTSNLGDWSHGSRATAFDIHDLGSIDRRLHTIGNVLPVDVALALKHSSPEILQSILGKTGDVRERVSAAGLQLQKRQLLLRFTIATRDESEHVVDEQK
mmetsp:Transcript_13298/g.32140  ORF Transcript_13298/g.32140 Transcript_13298/m.32140 type:complete len:224 (-) Transcript_13298:3-674(-)